MGRVDWIGSEAIGVPGQRTFRLLVQTAESSAQLWLEKEQLQALAEAVARMLLEIDTERGTERSSPQAGVPSPKPLGFPANPDIEMRIGKLGLRYDPQRDLIALEAFDLEAPEEEETPTLRCLVTRQQMEALQANSIEVVSAGRPRCPFCGTPLSQPGMPHFCPPTNGHQKLTSDE
jgi:uncharacterized repeat protein (TIGR03847 family)